MTGSWMRVLGAGVMAGIAALGVLSSSARGDRGGTTSMEPALAKRIESALSALKPTKGPQIPGVPEVRRARTAWLDISTTREQPRLDFLLNLAEKTRVTLDHYLGFPASAKPKGEPVPIVFCRPGEYRSWVDAAKMSEGDREHARSVANWCADGICMVQDDLQEPRSSIQIGDGMFGARVFESDRVITHLAGEYVARRFPNLKPWVQIGMSYVVCRELNGTTGTRWTGRSPYGSGLRETAPKNEMWLGGVFHPEFLSKQIAAKSANDLRLVLRAEIAALTAADDVYGLYFFDWCVHVADKEHTRLGAWLAGMDGGQDPEAALRTAFVRKETERVLEAVDGEFRQHHLAKYPPPDPAVAAERLARLPGTWTATRESVLEYKRKNGKLWSVQIVFKADGTLVRKKNDEEEGGTWEIKDDTVRLFFITKHSATTATVNEATFRDRELLYYGLVLRRAQ